MQKLGAPMLEEEVFVEIRRLAKGNAWLLENGKIRMLKRGADGWLRATCPLCAVYVALIGGCIATDGTFAGWGLGVPADLTQRIIAAADKASGHDEVLRRRLLKACGITT